MATDWAGESAYRAGAWLLHNVTLEGFIGRWEIGASPRPPKIERTFMVTSDLTGARDAELHCGDFERQLSAAVCKAWRRISRMRH